MVLTWSGCACCSTMESECSWRALCSPCCISTLNSAPRQSHLVKQLSMANTSVVTLSHWLKCIRTLCDWLTAQCHATCLCRACDTFRVTLGRREGAAPSMFLAANVAPVSSFHSCTSLPLPLKKTTVSMLLNIARYVSDVLILLIFLTTCSTRHVSDVLLLVIFLTTCSTCRCTGHHFVS